MSDYTSLRKDFENFMEEEATWRKYIQDQLENIDEGNLSASFKNYIKNGIKATAGITTQTGVDGAVVQMLAQFETKFNTAVAEVRAMANATDSRVDIIAQWKSTYGNDVASIASIGAKADTNEASITFLTEWAGNPEEGDTVASKVEEMILADETHASSSEFITYQGKVDTLEGTVEDQGEEIGTISSSVSTISQATNALASRVTTVESDYELLVGDDTGKSISQISSSVTEDILTTKDYATASMLASYSTKTEAQGYASQAAGGVQNALDTYKTSVSGIIENAYADHAFTKIFADYDDGSESDKKKMAEAIIQATNSYSSISLKADRITIGNPSEDKPYGIGVLNNKFYADTIFLQDDFTDVTALGYPGTFYWSNTAHFNSLDGEYYARTALNSFDESIGYNPLFLINFDQGNDSDQGNRLTFEVHAGADESESSAYNPDRGTKSILGYNWKEKETYPLGKWNFSSAQVEGLQVYFT